MNRELIITVTIMAALFIVEESVPFFKKRDQHLRHTAINVLFGMINGIFTKILFAGSIVFFMQRSKTQGIGLLNLFSGPWLVKSFIAFVLFDLWMYWWHRFNHQIKFLWCFHSMHHTDPEMDASTAFRFHPGEKILSSIARMLVIPIFGISPEGFAAYSMVLSPIILFHHSNIALPQRIDTILKAVIVTPNMHRVHHSEQRSETDSNYASVFSLWDRIFGTFRKKEEIKSIVYGLETMRAVWWQGILGMLLTPLYVGGILKDRKGKA